MKKTVRSKRPLPQGTCRNEHVVRQALLLAALTVAVFSPTLWSGFVYDSRLQILTDSFIHTAANWWNVVSFRVLGLDVLDFNRPVQLAVLMLDSAVWGANPFGYHLTSILLHAANTVLVFLVIRKLLAVGFLERPGFPAMMVPFLGALMFGIHPIMTEAVCEPCNREDLLVVFFSLSALLLASGHRNEARGSDVLRACLCTAACLLAVGSKETGIVAPLLLLFYWILLRRKDRPVFWFVTVSLAGILVALFLWLRFYLAPEHSVIFESKPGYPGGSFTSAMALMPRILVLYLQNLVWPAGLCADYGFRSIQHLDPVFCIILLGGLVVFCGLAARRPPIFLLAFSAVVLPLLPVANLIPIYRAAADRYLYFSMVGVAMTLAFFAERLSFSKKTRWVGITATWICLLALAIYVLINVERQKVWADSFALWQDTFQRNPNSSTAAYRLGETHWEMGRLEESEKMLREANRLFGGSDGDTLAMLAVVLQRLGREADSARFLELALKANPHLSDPDKRVAALALTRPEAEAIKKLLAQHPPGAASHSQDIRLDLSTGQLPALPQ